MLVILKGKAEKSLELINKGNRRMGAKIETFLNALENEQNPKSMGNALKMSGASNKYRWRIGSYRVVGYVFDDKLLIEVIDIDSRGNIYQKQRITNGNRSKIRLA